MSVFIGEKNKRVELAERKDAINPNLLLSSRDFSANWTVQNAAVTSDSYNGGNVVSIHPGGRGSNPVTQAIQTPPSQPVTWSVYAKADNAGDKLHSELWGNSGKTEQALTTDWCRYTFHGTFVPTHPLTYFWGVSGNKGDIYIALPKLEIGNTATPWCPAYDDYAWTSDITSLQNAVNNINSTRTPIVTGTTGDNLFDFKTSQIRLYPGNGKLCKNLPAAANTQWFTVQYIFESPNKDGIAIYRSPANEVWTIGNNGGIYNTSWVKLANSDDISDLQNQIQQLKDNQFEVQTFTDATAAANWEAQRPGKRMAIVNSQKRG